MAERDSRGELVIFTRFEYREQLMRNILSISGAGIHFFGEEMPEDLEL